MTLSPRLRRLALTLHVVCSVGWLGAVCAYLALAVTGSTTADDQLARAAYLAMELIAWFVIVPCSLAALASGLVQSLGTEWGLFRHYWVAAKFSLSAIGTAVLLGHLRNISRMALLAKAPEFTREAAGILPKALVLHAAGGLVLLIAATVLSIYKPWGRTAWGRRVRSARRGA